ncbi:MAG: hypothetical protein GVY02_03330 [Bacteroidetes bacterium]|jgi:tetratricopeptide (TPR) repeat protein|nr:hypothetical protein [Bacteroidota bacterium]
MKRIVLITLLGLLTATCSLSAQQVRFDEANSLLEQGRFNEAAAMYQSIADSSYTSGALWLNMGIAYSRLDSLGMAKYCFLRAEQFDETEERATQALRVVNDRFPRQSAVLPPLPWDRFINYLSENIGVTAMALFGLLFLYAAAGLIIGSWFRIDFRKALSRSGYSAIGLSLLCFFLALVIRYQDSRYDTGVMIQNEATVYAEPSGSSTVVSTAYEGYSMKVDRNVSEEREEWSYVRLENGMYGWIPERAIRTF